MPPPDRTDDPAAPHVFDVLARAALATKETPYGRTGTLVDEAGLAVVWVEKADDDVDPGWFEYERTDVLLVVQGKLKVEFRDRPGDDRVLEPGVCLVLPPHTACRAYRWPRDSAEPTLFVAAYAV
jgi:mannose-6-phosphate isomerase-like protein (cupin superfamily)